MKRLKAPPGRRSQVALQSTAPGKGLIQRTIKSGLVHRSKISSALARTRRRTCTTGPVVSPGATPAILWPILWPRLVVLLELAQQALHGVQPLLPIAARPHDPAIDLVERTGVDGEDVVAPLPVPLDHAARFQHADVFRHRVQGHSEGFRDLGHARLAAREPFDDRPPRRIGQRGEYRVEARGARSGFLPGFDLNHGDLPILCAIPKYSTQRLTIVKSTSYST